MKRKNHNNQALLCTGLCLCTSLRFSLGFRDESVEGLPERVQEWIRDTIVLAVCCDMVGVECDAARDIEKSTSE